MSQVTRARLVLKLECVEVPWTRGLTFVSVNPVYFGNAMATANSEGPPESNWTVLIEPRPLPIEFFEIKPASNLHASTQPGEMSASSEVA